MAQCKFKTGDRVHLGGNDCPEDSGTVQPDYCERLGNPDVGYVWVLWDSNGRIQQIAEYDIEHEKPSNQGVEFTVENCIDFLISQGYNVTLTKEHQ